MRILLRQWTVGIWVVLTGCSSVQHVTREVSPASPPATEVQAATEATVDGPPLEDHDVTHVSNAIPKVEPLSRYGNPPSYEVFGKRYKVMDKSHGYTEKGVASWYGKKFHGQRTSSGEPFDMFGMTAAHRSLPIPTYAKVKNLKNGKEVIVKVNDRGPFAKDRIIDLSYAAAKKLGFHDAGTAHVHVSAIDPNTWKKKEKEKEKNKAAIKKTTTTPQPIYLQLGAFNKKLSADELAKQASAFIAKHSAEKYHVHVMSDTMADHVLYRVRVGPIQDHTLAEKLKKQLNAMVVS